MNRQNVPGSRPAPQRQVQPLGQRAQQQQQQQQQQPSANGRQALGLGTSNMWSQPGVPPFPQTMKQQSFAQAVSNNGPSPAAPPVSQPSLDMSDFPALGSIGQQPVVGRPASTTPTNNNMSPGGQVPPGLHSKPSATNINSSVIPQPQQQQQLQQEPQRTPEQPEDFPALPGSKDGDEAMEKFGVGALRDVISMENNDQTSVTIGSEVGQMGLDFNNPPLAPTFGSPWIATSKHKVEPEYGLPGCYNVPSAEPQQQKLRNFTEETLFYIFYTMPRDIMQDAAAQELISRNWRYHKELKLWLTKDPLSEPVHQGNGAEQGIYIFFDPSRWEKIKKEYVLQYTDIA